VDDNDAPTLKEKVPATQFVHTEAPVEASNVPALQLRHAEDPETATALPAAQLVHDPDDDTAYLPALHVRQADDNVEPRAGEAVPAGHPTQLDEPGAV